MPEWTRERSQCVCTSDNLKNAKGKKASPPKTNLPQIQETDPVEPINITKPSEIDPVEPIKDSVGELRLMFD
jgi:hypothetical protein